MTNSGAASRGEDMSGGRPGGGQCSQDILCKCVKGEVHLQTESMDGAKSAERPLSEELARRLLYSRQSEQQTAALSSSSHSAALCTR